MAAATLSGAGCTRLLHGGLAAEAATDSGGLLSKEQVWELQLRMNALGPRYTGSPAHHAFIDLLASQLQNLGLAVHSEVSRFKRWEGKRASLSVRADGTGTQAIEVASLYPYCEPTPGDGIEGRLVYGGSITQLQLPEDLSGCILYLDAPAPALQFQEWYANPRLYGELESFPHAVSHAAAQIVTAPDLTSFAQRGARGVVLGWTNLSEAQVKDQYLPFNRPMQPIPGVWVGPGAARHLRQMSSAAGAQARLTLEAQIHPDAVSRTIYAELPGSAEQLLLVNSHTDGPNAVEENGPIGILSLAHRLAQRPRAQRRHSILFLLASGHFVGPQAPSTDGFLAAHPEILARTAAALTIEHLGAMEWADDPQRGYAATGKAELSLIFTQNDALAQLAWDVVRKGPDRRGAIVHPRSLSHFFGEGRPLARAGVPTLGFLPAPSYLLASPPSGDLEKLDPDLMHGQIAMLAALLDRLDAHTPAGRSPPRGL